MIPINILPDSNASDHETRDEPTEGIDKDEETIKKDALPADAVDSLRNKEIVSSVVTELVSNVSSNVPVEGRDNDEEMNNICKNDVTTVLKIYYYHFDIYNDVSNN